MADEDDDDARRGFRYWVRVSRTLELDPAVVIMEQDPNANAVREAAAAVYVRDDQRAAAKAKSRGRR